MPVKDLQPAQIRNIALVSPHGTGKTSLAEALLFRAKVTSRHGKVEDGTTALDFSPEEVHRKITISLAVAPLEWHDTKINLIDTPGYADFVGDMVAGLRVADSAVFCIKGSLRSRWARAAKTGSLARCALPPARTSDPTKSSRPSARAAWARSTAPATASSGVRWRSRSFRKRSRAIPTAWPCSSARPAWPRGSTIRTSSCSIPS